MKPFKLITFPETESVSGIALLDARPLPKLTLGECFRIVLSRFFDLKPFPQGSAAITGPSLRTDAPRSPQSAPALTLNSRRFAELGGFVKL